MSILDCKLEIPNYKEQGADITVGREFLFICDGEIPQDLNVEKLKIIVPEIDKYKIHYLGIETSGSSQIKLKVTSYKVGDHDLKAAVLTDDNHQLELKGIGFPVKSVIKPEEMVNEPYGPTSPFKLHLPWFYWALSLSILAIILVSIFVKVKRWHQKKKLIDGLKQHESALTPYIQFNQNMRRMHRKYSVFSSKEMSEQQNLEFVVEIEDYFKLFILRSFRIPAYQWSDAVVLREIKSINKELYSEYGLDLKKIYSELKKAKATGGKLMPNDLIQIEQMLRACLDKIQNKLNKAKGAKNG